MPTLMLIQSSKGLGWLVSKIINFQLWIALLIFGLIAKSEAFNLLDETLNFYFRAISRTGSKVHDRNLELFATLYNQNIPQPIVLGVN